MKLVQTISVYVDKQDPLKANTVRKECAETMSQESVPLDPMLFELMEALTEIRTRIPGATFYHLAKELLKSRAPSEREKALEAVVDAARDRHSKECGCVDHVGGMVGCPVGISLKKLAALKEIK